MYSNALMIERREKEKTESSGEGGCGTKGQWKHRQKTDEGHRLQRHGGMENINYGLTSNFMLRADLHTEEH